MNIQKAIHCSVILHSKAVGDCKTTLLICSSTTGRYKYIPRAKPKYPNATNSTSTHLYSSYVAFQFRIPTPTAQTPESNKKSKLSATYSESPIPASFFWLFLPTKKKTSAIALSSRTAEVKGNARAPRNARYTPINKRVQRNPTAESARKSDPHLSGSSSAHVTRHTASLPF